MQTAVHTLPPLPPYHHRERPASSIQMSTSAVSPPNSTVAVPGPSSIHTPQGGPSSAFSHLLPPTTPVPSRKRKRTVVNYVEVQELDPEGRVRDVIVIEDSPPPPSPALSSVSRRTGTGVYGSASYQPPTYSAPMRTRARAAAELSASTSVSTIVPPPKKRKREPAELRAPPAKRTVQQAEQAVVNRNLDTNKTTNSETSSASCDDKEGHYIIIPNDLIYGRYRTVKLLGQGTFGKVVEAYDTQNNNKAVAIKIIRAIPKYRDASRIEIRVLQRLKEKDPMNRHKCIHLMHWFDHRNHICIVSELLGMCVYDFLKENDFAPFPHPHIQSFARQLLGSVAFLHDLHLIHTDLKPENILLVHNDHKTITIQPGRRNAPPRYKRILKSTDIRLIDFGSATFEEEYHSTVVSTRHYRAPEIILGLGWSYPCDAYSLGCILVEFYTGVALYQTHDNLEHLAMMEAVMGPMPERFARAGARSKPEFFRTVNGTSHSMYGTPINVLDWPKAKVSKQSRKDVRATRSLDQVIPPTDRVNELFLDLVRRLLAFDPVQRITVRDALKHPYFHLQITSPEVS